MARGRRAEDCPPYLSSPPSLTHYVLPLKRAGPGTKCNAGVIAGGFGGRPPPGAGASPAGTADYLSNSSAICTALRAAPLSSWSPATQKHRPLSNAQSLRSRPTWQLYLSLAYSGSGYSFFVGIVHHVQAGRFFQDGAGGLHGDRLFKLRADRDGVGAINRHAHAGHAGAEAGMVHDFAPFVFHLRLFLGVAVGQKNIHVRQDVEGDLMRINFLRHRLAGDDLFDLPFQFLNGLGARCRKRPGSWRQKSA